MKRGLPSGCPLFRLGRAGHGRGRRPGRPQPLGLLCLAGHARPAIRSARQPTGQRQCGPGTQPVVRLLIGQALQRAQQGQKQERFLAIDAGRSAGTSGQLGRTLALGQVDRQLT